ncbi:MAG: hypothetical protein ABSC23_04150 [Bryobacteraceae bacterium]
MISQEGRRKKTNFTPPNDLRYAVEEMGRNGKNFAISRFSFPSREQLRLYAAPALGRWLISSHAAPVALFGEPALAPVAGWAAFR